MTTHLKISVPDSVVCADAFGDAYRFEAGADTSPSLDVPLVVYFGGAISTATYHARRDTEPAPIRELFERALAEVGHDVAATVDATAAATVAANTVDLLVVPCPPIGRSEPDFRARIFAFVHDELLPRTPNPTPSRVAFVGNSAGAHLAAMLAFESDAVRALATTGGVGMLEAAQESERRLLTGKRYRCFANLDDPRAPHAHAFWDEILSHLVSADVIERPGGHAFDEHIANGSALDAFRFALAAARETPA